MTSSPERKAGRAARRQAQISEDVLREAAPIREELFAQILEALQTGGVEARLPIVQRAIEASRSASSRAIQQTQDRLAAQGLSGTPFGENILANLEFSGRQQAGSIGPMFAQELSGLAPSIALGQPALALQGIGSAGNIFAQLAAARSAQIGGLAGAFGGMAGGLGMAGGGALASLFGPGGAAGAGGLPGGGLPSGPSFGLPGGGLPSLGG